MTSVAVIGGGPAGVEAALSASKGGAKVTLFEKSNCLSIARGDWPSILRGHRTSDRPREDSLREAGVGLMCGTPVSGARPGRVAASDGVHAFDSIVVATGSAFSRPAFPWNKILGTYILDSEASYDSLRASAFGFSRVVVVGSGLTAAEVAEKLSESGTEVTVFCHGGLLGRRFGSAAERAVGVAARDHGVQVFDAVVQRVLGVGRVEAVLAEGRVVPCDGVVVVPSRRPLVPFVDGAILGPAGGLAVDSCMRSQAPGIYAAGACAELSQGVGSVPVTRRSSSAASGRVAGTNASGGSLYIRTSTLSKSLFGVSFTSSGLCIEDALADGYDAMEGAALAPGGRRTATVVFERRSGTILGVQMCGGNAAALPLFLGFIVSHRSSVDDLLSIDGLGSTDISAITEAAAEGMRRRQRF